MKRYKYCKFCGLELENDKCTCESSINSRTTKILKIKCDTCKENIPKDSLYCPYCGIPQFVDGKNKNLEKELSTSPDVMKIYFGTKKKNNMAKLILLIIGILIIICVVIYLRSKPNVPEGLDESDLEINSTESQTVYKDMWIKKEGAYYCFDKDGNPVVDDWIIETEENGETKYYYFDIDGKLVTNSWVGGEYYVGSDGARLIDTDTPDGARVGKDGKVIVTIETILEKSGKQVISSDGGEIKGFSKDKKYAIFMESLTKVNETYNKVEFTYFIPKVSGDDINEVSMINSLLNNNFLIGNEFSNQLKSVVNSHNGQINSIQMLTYEQRQVTKDKYMFLVQGKLYPKKGLAEKIKFRVTYNRKNGTITILNISE